MGRTFPNHQPGVLTKIWPGTKTGTTSGSHRFEKLKPRDILKVNRCQWYLSKSPKFIEITCQFSLNAFFQSAIYNQYSKDFSKKNELEAYRVEEYDGFMDFMAEKIGGF